MLLVLVACTPSDGVVADHPEASPHPMVAPPGPALPAGFEGVPVHPIDRRNAAPDTVRFVALGDGGNGNTPQYDVADAMKAVCDVDGCEFALYLGDNIYFDGVDSVDDAQFQTKFESPYAEIDFPFYAALGNHDYGGSGDGYEFWKDNYEIEYTDHSEKWTMPGDYYDFTVGPAHFFALDTNAILWGFPEEQLAWLQDLEATNTSPWTIAYSHHPYISNGPHGNAGEYDGREDDPIDSGKYVKDFFDTAVCGQISAYFCGHDHSLQWPVTTCGDTELLISGAASNTTDIDDGDNPEYFAERDYGFVWVELSGDTFTGRYYNDDGELLFERSFTRPE